jgi:hypothetical protein
VGQEKVFVGYFDSDTEPLQIVGVLKKRCAGVVAIEVHRKLIGTTGKVYCCCMTFRSIAAAKQAIERLQNLVVRGNRVLVRRWVERTAANERRDIHWRDCAYQAIDKRERERRNYRSLKYVYNNLQLRNANVSAAQEKTASNPPAAPLGLGAGIEVSIVSGDHIAYKSSKLF